MISNELQHDKENIDLHNIQPHRKIQKKSVKARFRKGKTAQAIRRLTDLLKTTLEQPKPKLEQKVQGLFQLTGKQEVGSKSFICYDDRQAVGELGQMELLLKKRVMDNDVESEEEQIEACVTYLKEELIEAGRPWRQQNAQN